ncbi:hypothetical protein [Candidimonas nitroreducens]|uniref:hypothetical protein n=1 Tax=Candidimonas nitroreducens TaxID=683354 RepID=UPI001E299B4F|nr:hypothetical protein [Candidimonas nitroreducens]
MPPSAGFGFSPQPASASAMIDEITATRAFRRNDGWTIGIYKTPILHRATISAAGRILSFCKRRV